MRLQINFQVSGVLPTFVGTLENFWSRASEILCAGSVERMSTLSRTLANWIARLQLRKEERAGHE